MTEIYREVKRLSNKWSNDKKRERNNYGESESKCVWDRVQEREREREIKRERERVREIVRGRERVSVCV